MTITLIVPHAIVFILDPTNCEACIPEYVSGEPTASNESCVSVGTLADVDGETTISLEANAEISNGNARLTKVFEGSVNTPGSLLAVETSDGECILQIPIARATTTVSIWVDDVRCPSRVDIRAS